MYRTSKNENRYFKHKSLIKTCPFCNPKPEEIIKEGKHFRIFKNIFGYDVWDRQQVTKHLLLIPKKHLTSLKKLNHSGTLEYFQLLNNYIDGGFNAFTRPNRSMTKSKTHFHTHLIETSTKLYSKISFSANPYKLTFK